MRPQYVVRGWDRACSSSGRSGFIAASLIDGGFECYGLIASIDWRAEPPSQKALYPIRVACRVASILHQNSIISGYSIPTSVIRHPA